MRRNRTEGGRWGAHEPLPYETQKRSDQKLDEALAQTFPASDPPAQTQSIVHVGVDAPRRSKSSPHLR